jgi:hypothetical protein
MGVKKISETELQSEHPNKKATWQWEQRKQRQKQNEITKHPEINARADKIVCFPNGQYPDKTVRPQDGQHWQTKPNNRLISCERKKIL